MKDLLGRSEKANKQQEQHAAGLDKYDALLTLLRASPTFFSLYNFMARMEAGRVVVKGGTPVCVCVYTKSRRTNIDSSLGTSSCPPIGFRNAN